jgi:hypothetical protein
LRRGPQRRGPHPGAAYVRRPCLHGPHGAFVAGAEFLHTDLTDASLVGTDLTGAVFHRANLQGANLAGANLNEVALDGAQFEGALWREVEGDLAALPTVTALDEQRNSQSR